MATQSNTRDVKCFHVTCSQYDKVVSSNNTTAVSVTAVSPSLNVNDSEAGSNVSNLDSHGDTAEELQYCFSCQSIQESKNNATQLSLLVMGCDDRLMMSQSGCKLYVKHGKYILGTGSTISLTPLECVFTEKQMNSINQTAKELSSTLNAL